MADKNSNEFKWNFNLDDTDSDFTDIDFTNQDYERSDKDIQPVIFVRDETPKKKAASAKQPDEAERSAAPAAKRPATAARRPAARKTAAKKKKRSSFDLNWRLIALIAAAVLLVALVVVLLSQCGKQEEKAWTAVEADSKVKTLMDSYFAAKKDGDADAMRLVLVQDARVNGSVIGLEATIYSDYTNISLQQYPGINKNEAVICATYDTGLEMLKGTSVPTIGWFYAKPDETGNLRLMTTTELGQEGSKDINEYVKAAGGLLADTTVADIQARYNNAVNSNSILQQYLQNIKDGNYYTVPSESEGESGEDPSSTKEEPDSTPEEPAPTGNIVFVSSSSLRLRASASTEAEKLADLQRGYCVTVLEDTGEWLKVRDDVKTNPSSGQAQNCTNKEGYISKQYTVDEFSKIKWD